MLPRGTRIPRARFPRAKGTRAFFEFGSVSFFPELPPSGAVVVSKKIFKTSVLRHRAKRRLLNALKHALGTGKYIGGIVVYPNVRALTAPFSDIAGGLEKALIKFSRKG